MSYHRQRVADRRQRRVAPSASSDDDSIDCIIELLREVSDQHRKRKSRYALPRCTLRHIVRSEQTFDFLQCHLCYYPPFITSFFSFSILRRTVSESYLIFEFRTYYTKKQRVTGLSSGDPYHFLLFSFHTHLPGLPGCVGCVKQAVCFRLAGLLEELII